MIRRLALLYRAFTETLDQELGEERAQELIHQAIKAYGKQCGEETRTKVEGLGLPNTLPNYKKGEDLPSQGWKKKSLFMEEEKAAHQVDFCPLAAAWKELGATPYDRLYCLMDMAKYSAYNPALSCTHRKNVLAGDDCCQLWITKK